MKSQVVVIGKHLGAGQFELVGAGTPAFIVATTRVTAQVQRLLDEGLGPKVLADIELGDRDGVPCGVAVFVRELEANSEDLRRFEAALAPFRRAGIEDFVREPARHLEEVFASLPSKGFPSWHPQGHLVELFLREQTCFPELWWHDDPACGVEEMVGLLKTLGVKGRIPKAKILIEAQKDLDRPGSDEDLARDRLCEVLCFAANALLERAGRGTRFCGPFHDSWSSGEPSWMLSEPSFYAQLIDEGVLVRWSGEREKESHPYKRPPDLGELDLDNFPSGDEPF
jgi:hypothetical protein